MKVQVSKLGPHLTSEVDAERARAANLLGEVSSQAVFQSQQSLYHITTSNRFQIIQVMPGYVQTGSMQNHMAAFLSSRLADRYALQGLVLVSARHLQVKLFLTPDHQFMALCVA